MRNKLYDIATNGVELIECSIDILKLRDSQLSYDMIADFIQSIECSNYFMAHRAIYVLLLSAAAMEGISFEEVEKKFPNSRKYAEKAIDYLEQKLGQRMAELAQITAHPRPRVSITIWAINTAASPAYDQTMPFEDLVDFCSDDQPVRKPLFATSVFEVKNFN